MKFAKPLKIAFLGSRPVSLLALDIVKEVMQQLGCNLTNLWILTKSDDNPPEGVVRWWKLGALREKAIAEGLPLLEQEDDLISGDFDLVLSVFYNSIIPQEIIERIRGGITNLHFGYLPTVGYSPKTGSPHKNGGPYSRGTYRGCNILSHSILAQEEWQAVTFHFISEKIDLGPVIEYAFNQIHQDTTAWDLQIESEKKGLALLQKYLPLLIVAPKSIKTSLPASGKFPYYNRNSLIEIKVLDPKISDKRLELVARALSFPNTEPPHFLEKSPGGKYLKKYVIYKKGKGPVILKPVEGIFIQRIEDIT